MNYSKCLNPTKDHCRCWETTVRIRSHFATRSLFVLSFIVSTFAFTAQAETLIAEDFASSAANFTVVASGIWSVSSGRYHIASPVWGSTGQLGNMSVHDTVITEDFVAGGIVYLPGTASDWDDAALIFCYQDNSNYYYLSINESNDGNTKGIFKVSGGTVTELDDITTSISSGTDYLLEVERVGSSITAYIDGNEVASATDSAFTSGKVGFGTFNDAADFDDLMVFVGDVAVTGVTVVPTSLDLEVNESADLDATVAPSNATDQTVTWSSDDEDVAVVDANGLVTGVGAGSATITVTTNDGSYTDTCDVDVTAPTGALIDEDFSSGASAFTSVAAGTWSVSSGRYVLSSPGSAGFGLLGNISIHDTAIIGDFSLSTLARITGTASDWNDVAVVFGYVDTSNYYYVAINESNDGGTQGVFKVEEGTPTELADISYSIASDTDYTVEITRSGSSIVVEINSSQVASITDATYAGGKVGFGSKNDGGQFDDLEVYADGGPPQAVAPSFSPAGGTYTSSQSVTISTPTEGASIRYTTNGTDPSSTSGTVYSSAVSISSTTTLKAIAYGSGLADSEITSALYTINSGSSKTITSADGFYNEDLSASQNGTFTVTFSATPSISPIDAVVGLSLGDATGYSGMATIARFNSSGNIDARNGSAYQAASTISYSASTAYSFRMVVNVPAHTYSLYVTPSGGSEQTVGTDFSFRSEQSGVAAVDSWTASVLSTPGGSLTVSNVTVSGATTAVSAPAFSPTGGNYVSAQNVTISTATSGATIRYTTDGTTPTSTTGTVYSSAINISATTVLKAIAYKGGSLDSPVSTATYIIGGGSSTPTRVPSFGPNGTHWPSLVTTPFMYDTSVPNIINVACSWSAIGTALSSVTTTQAAQGVLIKVAPGNLTGFGAGGNPTPVLSNLGNAAWSKRVTICPRDGYGTVTFSGGVAVKNFYKVCFAGFKGDSFRYDGGSHCALAWTKLTSWLAAFGASGQTMSTMEFVEVAQPVFAIANGDVSDFFTNYGTFTGWRFDGCYAAPHYYIGSTVPQPHCDTAQFALTGDTSKSMTNMTIRDGAYFGSNNCAWQTNSVNGLTVDHSYICAGTVAYTRYPYGGGGTTYQANFNGSGQNFHAIDSIFFGNDTNNTQTTSRPWASASNTRVDRNYPPAMQPLSGSWIVDTSMSASNPPMPPIPTDAFLNSIWQP